MTTDVRMNPNKGVGYVASPRPEQDPDVWDIPSYPDLFFVETLLREEVEALESSPLVERIEAFGGGFVDLASGEEDELEANLIPALIKAIDSIKCKEGSCLSNALFKIGSIAKKALANERRIIFWL